MTRRHGMTTDNTGGVTPAALRIEIFPNDLDAVVDFYTRVLGFALVRDQRVDEAPYVALQRGNIRIGAVRREDPVDLRYRRPPGGVEIVFEVADVVAERDRISSLWSLEEDLVDRPWGLTDFRLLDPAGYYVRVTGFANRSDT
jgi:lactoylglutathione lyase